MTGLSALLHSPLFAITLVLGAYQLSLMLYRKSGQQPFLHPTIGGAVMVAGVLILLDIDYTAFNTSAGWLNFWLGADDNGTYETILSRKAPQRMWRPVMPANDAPTVNQHIGMGFFQIDHAPAGGGKTRRYVGHTGDQKAFTVFVYADPATNAAAIFASNTLDENIPPAEALLRVTRKDLFETIFPLFAE